MRQRQARKTCRSALRSPPAGEQPRPSCCCAARWLFGGFYAYVGASWYSHVLFGTHWPDHRETVAARALTTAMAESGIVFPLISGVCLAGGLLLLARRTAPLGIAVLAPLVCGIFIFHLVLNQNWPWGTLNLGWLAVLAWLHRGAFRPLWSYGATRTGTAAGLAPAAP